MSINQTLVQTADELMDDTVIHLDGALTGELVISSKGAVSFDIQGDHSGATGNLVVTDTIRKPVILNPIQDQTATVKGYPFLSSQFQAINGLLGTHYSTDWEIATDSGFTTIVDSRYGDTRNLTSLLSGRLGNGVVYYIRVRHNTTSHSSVWSDTVSFTTEVIPTVVYRIDSTGTHSIIPDGFITASDAGAGDRFGHGTTISKDGSVLAIGTPGWDGSAGTDQGGVYVYDWDGSSWLQRGAVVVASDAGASDYFGISTALSADGSVLAVGAYLWDGPAGTDQGAVYVYDWNGTAWIQRGSVLTASDAGASDWFGISTALSDDASVLAVGAHGWDGPAGTAQGTIYIYDWDGTSWVQRGAVVVASDAETTDYFGVSTALSADGSVLVVGAYGWDGPAGTAQGGVYIYDWDGSGWVQRGSVLTASDAGAGDGYGIGTALSADGMILAVGAFFWDGPAGTDQGAVYTYDWDGTNWIQRGAVLTASDAGAGDKFGRSVSLNTDGSVLAVGAYAWDGPAGTDQGGVYIYNI